LQALHDFELVQFLLHWISTPLWQPSQAVAQLHPPLGQLLLQLREQPSTHLGTSVALQCSTHAGIGLQSLLHGKLPALHDKLHCDAQSLQAMVAAAGHPIPNSTTTSTANTAAVLGEAISCKEAS
jgi:hypothetical protein